MRKIRIMVWIGVLFLGITACQAKEKDTLALSQTEFESNQDGENSDDTDTKEYLFVYVCGAVNREGVYELPIGCRVFEAIEAAGGFREDADTHAVNQAELLRDEERIYVPVIGETADSHSEEEGKVNINKASKEQLMTLPGVGASRADSIIKYREEQGNFQSIEDIMQVSGIKEGLFEKIKDFITV